MGVTEQTTPFFTTVQKLPLLSNVISISCSNVHASVLLSNGSVAMWGYNANKEIFGSTGVTSAPVPMIVNTSLVSGDPIQEIATSIGRTTIRTASGRVLFWPAPNDDASMTDVTNFGLPSGVPAIGISGHGEYIGARLSDGSLYTYGYHYNAVAGTSSSSCSDNRFCVTMWSPDFTSSPPNVTAFALSNQWAAAVDSSGQLWFAGKLRWAFSAVPRLADRWHRPESPTYGKIVIQVGDSPNGPVYITSAPDFNPFPPPLSLLASPRNTQAKMNYGR
jgi:hypothetical protein